MTVPPDGWDQEERELLELEGLRPDLEAMRARHTLAPEKETALFERTQQAALRSSAPRARGIWRWTPLVAVAAGVLIATAVWSRRTVPGPSIEGVTPPDSAAVSPAPVFHLPLEKPDLKVSTSALGWRGPQGENTLLSDLKPAFDAFRADDYPRADREFSALSVKYPRSVEVALYHGVARLFVGNVTGALASLTAAEGLAESDMAWDVTWYRAVAEERAGNPGAARARLAGLCAQPDPRATIACDALKRLPGGRAPAP
jgi:hypothetical protein